MRMLRTGAMKMVRIGAVALVLLLAGCSVAPPPPSALSASSIGRLVSAVPETATSTEPATRLAKGLTPPTNRWFSGLVFGDAPKPVFPLPLSFALVEGGFQFGLPTVTSAPGAISAPAAPQLTVRTGADEHVVSRYDDVSVTIDDGTVGATTIARGSPVVSFAAQRKAKLELSTRFEARGDGLYTATVDGTEFALVVPDGSVDGVTVSLPKGAVANWLPVPDDGDAAELAEFATGALTGVRTSYSSTRTTATTALRYSADEPTLFGVLPHQRDGLVKPASCDLGTFETAYGEMELCGGTSLRWSVPAAEPATGLDLSGLSAAERTELDAQLGRDIAATDELPGDTYFGGKALARLATLLQIARELDSDAAVTAISSKLDAALLEWTEPDGCEQRSERCFAYDPSVRGMVGQAASFGSDEFNDHHFHYGYFLFAAGVAAQDDPKLAARLKPVMTLVAADIASGSGSSYFPQRRVFDAYSGHSWASGYSPFADGNNQESSSEAVAAWNGLAAWAAAADDDALEREARWMLSAEANSARAYWLGFDTTTEPYADYDRSIVGIVWDGKRDYGTWFSAERSAILGIQLLPLSPVTDASGSNYLAGDPERIRANVAEAGEPGQFADYILMYQSLAGSKDAATALRAAADLPDSAIDDGNSRTYMTAFIMANA
jgi:endo-1,3(4)-beta-glucanase